MNVPRKSVELDAPIAQINDKNILDLDLERAEFTVLLEESRKKEELTDVQLKIGDELFPAHRIILSLYSPVLKAMFSDQWSTTKICPISDEHVDPFIVEELLHFLYTGSIQLTPDNVHPVCVAAHLQIPSLLEPSVKHLCQLISVENVLELFEFSVTCQLESLHYSCLQIMAENHGRVFQDHGILEFSSRSFNDLIACLKAQYRPSTISDMISITMLKENTFDCIVRWTEVNLSERLNELPGLLKNIPLEELSLNFLAKTVSDNKLVKKSISCIETVSEVLANIELQRGDNLVVLGRNGLSISYYDPTTKSCKKLPPMLQPRNNFAATVVNRKDIVVCGGISYLKGESLDTVEMFEWSSQSWKQLPVMPFCSTSCSVASLDDHLYVIGKQSKFTGCDEVVCYSFETQQWRYVKPMNVSRNHAKLIEYDGYLYVFGDRTVERYDPVLDEWTCINKIHEIYGIITVQAVSVHDNKIHVNRNGSLHEFDPETNAWTRLSEEGYGGSLTWMNGQLLDAKKYTKWIYEFCNNTKKWIKFLELDEENCLLVTGQFY